MIELRQGSWYEPLKDVQGKLSGIISNPPYIPSDNIFGLQAEVGKHEPRVALDGGTSGMDDLIHLCDEAALMLKPGGFFAFEVRVTLFPKLWTLIYILFLQYIFCSIKLLTVTCSNEETPFSSLVGRIEKV